MKLHDAGAQEKKDAWAVCMLTWLQGQPATALQGLMPKAEPDQASPESSDRSVTPGQLNTSLASVSGRDQPSLSSSSIHGPTTGQIKSHGHKLNDAAASAAADESAGVSHGHDVSFQTGKHWDKALALDLLSYCLASGTTAWPGQLPTLGQLCQLAVEASHALEVTGHPVMALESLQIAQMCCKRLLRSMSSPPESQQASTGSSHRQHFHQQQQQVLGRWQDRLVTACLTRCLVDAITPPPPPDPLLPPAAPLSPQDAQHFISQRWTLHRHGTMPTAPVPNLSQWKKLAQQQLKILSDAGVEIDSDSAMARLQAVYDSLLPTTSVGAEEGAGVEVEGAGLFRSVSGMSAMSTPRRNSTLSR